MSAPPPSPRGGMSLYANLLESNNDNSPSVSRHPVVFNQEAAPDSAPKKPIDPALRFQPIRRPQAKQPNKPKPAFPKAPPSAPTGTTPGASTVAAAPQPRSTLADWAATEEDEYLYGTGSKRQRGGRRKKRKKNDDVPLETDWDELYDPSRPTNVEEYLRSDERIREVREWKDVLYAHRQRRPSYDSSMNSDHEDDNHQFAPPPSLSFAPPPLSPPRPPPPDETADDVFARRLALSNPPPPPPPPPPPTDAATISRAPVRYSPPPQPMETDDTPPYPPQPASPDTRSTNRPGQSGFAQRLMAKYGWSEGSGLGASEDGMKTALRVQVEKRRRRPDAEGGGFAEPGGRGKIIAAKSGNGGKNQKEGGKFGKMSETIVLKNMLEGMSDLEGEIEAGLQQEIGEECGEKYGRVERLYIEREMRLVFIKFTDQVSALRAVNALEGRVFNGNVLEPSFYDTERFENGIYS
ncbi:hypothetical protein OQA88_13569 [Cercophora sp. LCS_1]